MALYELEPGLGPLTAPVLVVAFNGWVSAGQAGMLTADHLAAEGRVIATFDSDRLFDYRANRPTVDFVDGVMDAIQWPELTLRLVALGGRDLLGLSGTEPNWNWRLLGSEVADLALEMEIVEHVSIGAVPWATPHTRPTSIITTASKPEMIPSDQDHPQGLLRVPGAAVSVNRSEPPQSAMPATWPLTRVWVSERTWITRLVALASLAPTTR